MADCHLGLAPSGARYGEVGGDLRRARSKAVARAVEIATEREVDLIIIAGDLFETESPGAVVASAALKTLSAPGIPVAVIPGNHDPLTPRSVWERAPWDSPPESVKVFREPAPVEQPWGLDIVLYPCPLLAKDGSASPVAWIKEARAACEGKAGLHVGLAHGTVMRMPEFADTNFPIQPDEPATLSLDYLALGHYHRGTGPGAAARQGFAYSGTTEPTGFGEPEGGALLVELGDAPLKIERVATGVFVFRDFKREIIREEDPQRLLEEIRSLPNPERTLVRLKLEGSAPLIALASAGEMREGLLEAGFASVDVNLKGLRPCPSDIEFSRMPQGPLRRAMEILLDREKSAEDKDKEAAARAVALAWTLFGIGN